MRWSVHGERRIYESEWVSLALTDVEIPGGERFQHHVIRVPCDASGAVVVADERGLLLLCRPRFLTHTRGWALPAGPGHPRVEPGGPGRRAVPAGAGGR